MTADSETKRKTTASWRTTVGGTYFAVFVVGMPMSIAASDIYTAEPVFVGQASAIIVFLAASALSLLLWLIYPESARFSGKGYAALLAWVAVWTFFTSRSISDGQMVDYRTYLVPLLLLMLVAKPPTKTTSVLAGTALVVFTFVGIAITDLQAQLSGRRPTLQDFGVRFLDIGMSEPSRWYGPFENPNAVGPVLAMIAIYAVSLRGFARSGTLVIALVLLIGTGSRSAFLGLLIGMAIHAIYSKARRLDAISQRTRVVTIGVAGLTLVAVLVYLNPTLNGRTPIWSHYWSIWQPQLLNGVGAMNTEQHVVTDSGTFFYNHAHNILLDAGSRFGVIGVLLLLSALVLSLLAVLPAANNGRSVGFALLAAYLVIGIVEVPGPWQYWNMPWLWMIIGITLTSVQGRRDGTMSPYENGGPESAGCQSAGMRSIDGYRT